MHHQVARFFSYLLHPLVMPTLGMWLILNTNTYLATTPSTLKHLLLLFVAITTLFFPAIGTFIMYRTGYISTLEIDARNERKAPYLYTLLFYAMGYYYIHYHFPVSPLIKNMMLGVVLAVLFTFLINLRWKISAHMTGIGGLTGALVALAFVFESNLHASIALAFLLSGLLGSFRIYLGAHSHSQVYAGFMLGFFTVFLFMISSAW